MRLHAAQKLISYQERDKIDDAGNYYNMLGWAFARGKGKPVSEFGNVRPDFCRPAPGSDLPPGISGKDRTFDEEHFAYLEDTDIGYRARLLGYENWYGAVREGFTTSERNERLRYNLFKIRYSSRNNIYLIYKNMPVLLDFAFNLPKPLSSVFGKTGLLHRRDTERISGRNQEWFFITGSWKTGAKDPFRVEAPRYVFCHRMGAFINVFRRFLERA